MGWTVGLKAQQTPYVILVSFDGFRHDYVERLKPPHFTKFIENGSKAEALIPVFPSKTFPNHYSIVTGLYPGTHGLVDNYFFDRNRMDLYSMKVRKTVTDPYFYNGTPLWKLAQQAGIKSASYFWVGSEIPQSGWHPDYYYPYDEEVTFESRVDKVMEWLTLPEKERPHFITLYFSSPDRESDDYGPMGEATKQAIYRVDSLLGRLMEGLSKINLPVNVILVSDHGVKEIVMKEQSFIFLQDLQLKNPSIRIINGGSQVHIYTRDKKQSDSLYSVLQSKQKHFRVLKRSEFPQRWHYDNERSGDLLLVADRGYYIKDGSRTNFENSIKEKGKIGVHGYDAYEEKDMWGIFYAQGPNIKQGEVVPPFENIHIYPLIAQILQLQTPRIDGDSKVLNKIYKK